MLLHSDSLDSQIILGGNQQLLVYERLVCFTKLDSITVLQLYDCNCTIKIALKNYILFFTTNYSEDLQNFVHVDIDLDLDMPVGVTRLQLHGLKIFKWVKFHIFLQPDPGKDLQGSPKPRVSLDRTGPDQNRSGSGNIFKNIFGSGQVELGISFRVGPGRGILFLIRCCIFSFLQFFADFLNYMPNKVKNWKIL